VSPLPTSVLQTPPDDRKPARALGLGGHGRWATTALLCASSHINCIRARARGEIRNASPEKGGALDKAKGQFLVSFRRIFKRYPRTVPLRVVFPS